MGNEVEHPGFDPHRLTGTPKLAPAGVEYEFTEGDDPLPVGHASTITTIERPHPRKSDVFRMNRAGFPGGCFGWILRCDRHLLKLGVEAGFGFGGRHVSDGFEQAAGC